LISAADAVWAAKMTAAKPAASRAIENSMVASLNFYL
jgi:hypothetical protein